MLVISSEGAKTPEQLINNGKPTLLVQAGIHSGEIDGKDAGLMLLRDILKGNKADLIKEVNWLFVPILSADAHERTSPFNRVNQRGPISMGWRTNARNLNLNRDYMKLETLELQALIKAVNQWQPDLYYDVHVTDGEDYQYDITYGYNTSYGPSSNIHQWLSEHLQPAIDHALEANGHLAGPLTFGMDRMDFSKGIVGWTATPRYSNGYGDYRHLPTILWENHSLKPYKQRVLGTYIYLEETLKLLASKGKALIKAIEKDRNSRPEKLTVAWQMDMKNPTYMDYKGIEFTKAKDPITGLDYVKWTGKPKLYKDLPIYWMNNSKATVKRPKSYWIPSQYKRVIEILKSHGIKFKRHKTAKQIIGTRLKVTEHKFSNKPFEGKQMPQAKFGEEKGKYQLPQNSIEVSTDQELGNLAIALLDPRATDSLFAWGYFNTIFQRTEYIESYTLIPLARKLFEEKPELQKAFNKMKKENKEFAENSRKQMEWIYAKSNYYDREYLKYPVIIED